MKDLCIQIKVNNLKRDVSDNSNIYHAHLIFDDPVTEITLKVYFDSKSHFQREFEWGWNGTNNLNNSETFCKNLEFIKTKQNKNIENIDFSQCKWALPSISTNFFDVSGQYVIFRLDSIRIVYNPLKKYQETDLRKSQFFLNKAALKLIESLYSYQSFVFEDERNIWKGDNKKGDIFQFGEIKIRLGYHFYSKENKLDDTVIIHKRPLLDIQSKGIDENQIHNYKKLIFSILSLYRNELIDFDFARISNNEARVEISKINTKVILSDYVEGLEGTGFEGGFIELLKAVQPEKILDAVDDFSKFCERYLLGKKLSGESQFMIFYNLLEQIRNKYISSKTLNQEYEFTISNSNKVKKIIRDKLREIAEIVVDEQKEQFKENVICHQNTIKLIPMKNQFQDLFDMFLIDLEKTELDFQNMKNVRNKIYHGHSIDNEKDMNFLQKANKELPVLVGKLLLKMVGAKTDVEEEYFMDI